MIINNSDLNTKRYLKTPPSGIGNRDLSMSHRVNYEATVMTTQPPRPGNLSLLYKSLCVCFITLCHVILIFSSGVETGYSDNFQQLSILKALI